MISSNGHGSANQHDDDSADNLTPALTKREYHLLATVIKITKWLAKYPRDSVIGRCQRELGMNTATAEKWIQKADDYLSLGVIEGMRDARELYVARLNDLYHSCSANLISDQVEVTTKPVKLKVIGEDGKVVGLQEVEAKQTKVKVARFNADAHALALKLAKEIAYIQGARGADGPTHQINVQVNNNAQSLDGQLIERLSNEQLAHRLGGQLVEFNPDVKDAMETSPQKDDVVEGDAEEREG